jgi:parvulin-like peptidyl-prolyl isomerase
MRLWPNATPVLAVLVAGFLHADQRSASNVDGEAFVSTSQPTAAASPRYADVVATVNGDPVRGRDLERLLDGAATRKQLSQELGDAVSEAALEQLALRKLIQRTLLLQESAKRELGVSERELDSAIVALRRRFPDLTSFGEWMKDNGVDDQSMFTTIRQNLLIARTTGALVETVTVNDEAIRSYYDSNADKLRFEEAWIQVIVVETAEAAAEIQEALARGEDFGALARQRSTGKRAASGGDVRWVKTDDLWQPLRNAIADVEPGQAIGPLRRDDDEWLIVRLEARRPGALKTLAEATPQIKALLLLEQQRHALRDWYAAAEASARIESFLVED